MNRHMNDFWNVVDLLSYLCIIAAVFFRHLYQDESHVIARNLFALSLLVMYLRFLEVFLIHHKMGPTLMMIKEMVFFFWREKNSKDIKTCPCLLCSFIFFRLMIFKYTQKHLDKTYNISCLLNHVLFFPAEGSVSIPVDSRFCNFGSWNILSCQLMAWSPSNVERWNFELGYLENHILPVLAALRGIQSRCSFR